MGIGVDYGLNLLYNNSNIKGVDKLMFREMRRIKQQLSAAECEEILRGCTAGTLALSGDDGYPYAVPISYVFESGKLYFHSALTGHKLDAVKRSDKASFCVIADDDVLPEKFTTVFRSVIAFGKIRVIEDTAEKRRAIELLSDKYSPNLEAERDKEIADGFERMCMLELSVEHMTGKEAIERTRRRTGQC